MRKEENHNFAWIVATSPEQVENIKKNKITFGHESIDVTIGKPSGDDLAKKNALILITKNLNKLKPKIRACIGEKNILNIFFKTDDKGKLTGVCNVQCLNTAVYKKFVKKNHKICNTALANTVEAMENAPSNGLRKKDIHQIVEEVVAKKTAIVRDEMQTMETRLTSQVKSFATYAAEKTTRALKKKMATL